MNLTTIPDPETTFYVWRVLNSPEFTADERRRHMAFGNLFSVIGLGRPLFELGPDAPKARSSMYKGFLSRIFTNKRGV